MLRLAGFSPGTGVSARGGWSAGRCGFVAAFCVRLVTGGRFYWSVLRSITPAVCRLSAKRDGLRYVSFLFRRGSGSPVVRSRASIRLFGLAGSLRAWAFSYGDPDRERRDARTRRTESAARRECVFCVNILALLCFPRGVRWGCAPQTCAKESLTPWTLFI